MAEVVLGVDCGSSSVRALALDAAGVARGVASAAYPGAAGWPHGRAEPDGWLRGLEAAIAALIERVPDAARPAAVGVGGQSPTTVALEGGLAVTCVHPAGMGLPPEKQHESQHALLRAEAGADVVPLQVWDWILLQLGADKLQGRWPGEPGLPGYGRSVPTGTVVGRAGGRYGVRRGTPLACGAQDAHLSFWAAGIDTPGMALDPGGRTGGLGVAVGTGVRPPGMFSMPGAARGTDIVGAPVNGHGAMLEWWSRVSGRPIAELLELAAAVPPGARGVIALPYLDGERAPRWNTGLRAELTGLGASTGPGEITRALLEATAYGLAHIALELSRHEVAVERLVCGGTPARSPLWCSIKAAVLEVPVEVPAEPNLAAYGAALAAGTALGWWPAPGDAGPGAWPRPEMEVLHPAPAPEYRAGLCRFIALGDDAERRLRRSARSPAGEAGP